MGGYSKILKKKILIGLFVLLFFASIFTAAAIADDWAMFRNDAAHTGYSTSNPSSGALSWTYTTGGAVDSSPAVVGGVVYIGSSDDKVYALNAHAIANSKYYGRPYCATSTNRGRND